MVSIMRSELYALKSEAFMLRFFHKKKQNRDVKKKPDKKPDLDVKQELQNIMMMKMIQRTLVVVS